MWLQWAWLVPDCKSSRISSDDKHLIEASAEFCSFYVFLLSLEEIPNCCQVCSDMSLVCLSMSSFACHMSPYDYFSCSSEHPWNMPKSSLPSLHGGKLLLVSQMPYSFFPPYIYFPLILQDSSQKSLGPKAHSIHNSFLQTYNYFIAVFIETYTHLNLWGFS